MDDPLVSEGQVWGWPTASQLANHTGKSRLLADINAVEVVGAEGSIALGTLPLTCVVARLHALKAEHVEALGQHSVLHP